MKSKLGFHSLLHAASALALACPLTAATVMYSDTFDNDGLGTNTGTGGGMAQRTIQGISFTDNGSLVTPGPNGGNRAVASSINSFSLTHGFILEVVIQGVTSSIMESFGMSTSQFSSDTNAQDWLRDESWAGQNASHRRYGIGVELGSQQVAATVGAGLSFNDGLGTITQLNGNVGGAGTNTFTLTVTPDDQFSYSVNGGTAVTGEIVAGAGSFDLSNPLFFNVFSQGTTSISSVTLSAIPEPSSALLLSIGLGGLLVRRRKA